MEPQSIILLTKSNKIKTIPLSKIQFQTIRFLTDFLQTISTIQFQALKHKLQLHLQKQTRNIKPFDDNFDVYKRTLNDLENDIICKDISATKNQNVTSRLDRGSKVLSTADILSGQKSHASEKPMLPPKRKLTVHKFQRSIDFQYVNTPAILKLVCNFFGEKGVFD